MLPSQGIMRHSDEVSPRAILVIGAWQTTFLYTMGGPSGVLPLLIHPSSWKGNSQKFTRSRPAPPYRS